MPVKHPDLLTQRSIYVGRHFERIPVDKKSCRRLLTTTRRQLRNLAKLQLTVRAQDQKFNYQNFGVDFRSTRTERVRTQKKKRLISDEESKPTPSNFAMGCFRTDFHEKIGLRVRPVKASPYVTRVLNNVITNWIRKVTNLTAFNMHNNLMSFLLAKQKFRSLLSCSFSPYTLTRLSLTAFLSVSAKRK